MLGNRIFFVKATKLVSFFSTLIKIAYFSG